MNPTALIVGASRTLGLGIATELVDRGWDVIGTVRGTDRTALHDATDTADGHLTIEMLDMTRPEEISALRDCLASTTLELLFVNAAIADPDIPVGKVSTDTFNDVMVTNALSPLRVLETFGDLVSPTGSQGVMSSTQGSIAMNTHGGHEVYRASKSALNQLMRSYAARPANAARSLLLIDPGWVRTKLGGPGATRTVEQSAPAVVNVLISHLGEPGLQFLNYHDATVPW